MPAAACGSENLTSIAPRCASTSGAIDSTRALKRWLGKASARTLAGLADLQLLPR
jgi:hypothetical protein